MSLYILEIKNIEVVEGQEKEIMNIKKKLEKEFDCNIEVIQLLCKGVKRK